MNKKIYSLLKEYSSKELDDNFINAVFYYMLEENYGLNEYIKSFEIDNYSDISYGAYSNEDKIMKINKDKIIEEDHMVKNKKILTLGILRHEIEHAIQLKRLFEFKKDIESRVVEYSLRPYELEHGLVPPYVDNERDYKYLSFKKIENYSFDPGERLAEIKAWKYVVNLIKNQNCTEELLNARSMLYCAYIRGYINNGYYLDPPTYEYLINTGLFHDYYLLKKTVNEKDYSFDTRLTCGLPLTNEEYDRGILQKVKLRKKEKK